MSSLWLWIGNPNKQKLLDLIGAGIAGLVTVLDQFGLIGNKNSPLVATSAPVAPAASPTVRQSAESSQCGTAFNLSGNRNTVTIIPHYR
jgi:hypothetical protein